MRTQDIPLPEFEDPPVDEVALGVSFPPIPGFEVPHLGLYWSRVRDRYPYCQTMPPIFPMAAQSGGIPIPFFVGGSHLVRAWFLDRDGVSLVQLQSNWFLRNWRKVKGDEVYPRYLNELRSRFQEDWSDFTNFLGSENLPIPKLFNCEACYVNVIEKGCGWNTFSDLPHVTTLWRGIEGETLLDKPQSANVEVSYAMDNSAGRVQVVLSPSIRARDGKEVLQLTLTARSEAISGSNNEIIGWLDRARECIVRGFADVTTPSMHKLWKRRN